ncbi:hypothetical protein [Tenacibaculum sp. 190524A02b]|uniref:Uncharacterized protein n=1 Tax=Tenacibaculum vairaonense TaxID=3137860 RepID=A0ABM9PRP9_9FLAO
MIITWNTTPESEASEEEKLSSYYQYDTVSKKLVRIRLELGREESTGQPRVIYNEDRAVGFSDIDFIEEQAKYPDSDFTIDPETKQLLVKGEPMDTEPSIGASVVDMTLGTTKPHFGNAVSDNPNLPEGITNTHLSLIANNTLINGKGGIITGADSSEATLSETLKNVVSGIVKKPFDEIDDDDLLKVLKNQVTKIKNIETAPTKTALSDSLEDASKLIEVIQEQITDEGMVPTEQFNKSYSDYVSKVTQAEDALSSGTGVQNAIAELATAKTALNAASSELQSSYYERMETQFNSSQTAIDTAVTDAQTFEGITSEYEAAENADTLDQYEQSIGLEETEAI